MVKIVKSRPSFPFGAPGLRMSFPAWNTVPSVSPQNLKGLYRGDFLYFSYKAKSQQKDKKINNNPLVLFEGLDQNGNIIGTNMMFFNQYIDPKTGKKEVNTKFINAVLDTMRAVHWDDIYETGDRKAYTPFIKSNFLTIFGRSIGHQMGRFWRTYRADEISSLSNITIDSALEILSSTNPTFIKSTESIK